MAFLTTVISLSSISVVLSALIILAERRLNK